MRPVASWEPLYKLDAFKDRWANLFGYEPAKLKKGKTADLAEQENWRPLVDIGEDESAFTKKAELPDIPRIINIKRALLLLFIAVVGFQAPQSSGQVLPLDQGFVHAIYFSPADVMRKEHYERAILSAAFDLQHWYASELGGASFSMAPDPVTWFQLPEDASYYRQNVNNLWFWDKVLEAAAAIAGASPLPDENDLWVIYIDVDPLPGQIFGGSPGIAVLPANDLRGLTFEPLVPINPGDEDIFKNFPSGPSRWVGGLGHELAHAFGLGHPDDDDEANKNSLMGFGYLDYPDTFFADYDRDALLIHPLISGDYLMPRASSIFSRLTNGGFEDVMNAWSFYTNGAGEALVSDTGYISPKKVAISIDAMGTNTQLYQRNINLLPNTEYVFVFAGRSNSGNDLGVTLSNNSSPHVNYGMNRKGVQFDLTPAWQYFIHRFTTKGFNSEVRDGKLFFWLADYAQVGDQYCLDDVALAPVMRSETEVLEQPMAPGNLNGMAMSDTEVLLTWDPSGKGYQGLTVLGYFVYRNGEYVGAAATNCYLDSGLDPATDYDYEVRAFNSSGYESMPSFVSIGTLPLLNAILNGGFEQGGLYWQLGNHQIKQPGYAGAKSASICLRGTGGELLLHQNRLPLMARASYRLSFDARSTKGDDIEVSVKQGLNPRMVSLTNEWRRVNLLFNTPDSGPDSFEGSVLFRVGPDPRPWQCYEFDNIVLTQFDTADTDKLEPPTSLESSLGSATLVSLSWEPPVNNISGLGYFIYRNGEEIAMTTETEYIDYGLRGGDYTYLVVAFDTLGRESLPSNSIEVRTPGEPTTIDYNLVRNSSFDEGVSYWDRHNLTAYDSIVDPFEGGRYDRSGRVHFPLNPTTANLFQTDITLEPETEYNISFAARSNRPLNDEIVLNLTALSLGILGSPREPYSYGLDNVAVEVSTEWQVYFITFETPPSFAREDDTTLSFDFKDWSGLRGSYSLDRIVITKKGFLEEALTPRP